MDQTQNHLERTINFEELIKLLQTKINTEIDELQVKRNKTEASLQNSMFTCDMFNAISMITSGVIVLGAIAGLGGLSWSLFSQSKHIFDTVSSATAARDFSIVALALGGATGAVATGAAVWKSISIYGIVNGILDVIMVDPLERSVDKKKSRTKDQNQRITRQVDSLRETLKSIETMHEDFKYMIHSSLKDKTFTQAEVDLVYKHLTANNINAVIYLLYHDDLQSLERLTSYEKDALAENLKRKITKVKEYSFQLQTTPSQTASANESKRIRRVERLHTYPYDDMIEKHDSSYEERRKSSRR